jgi:hypothetical protein
VSLIIEDGTGKADSQSYASEAAFASYALERGVPVKGTDTKLLITAMDYLESKNFIGDKATRDQALQWPRVNAAMDGYYIDYDSIPQLLIDAQIEIALSIDAGANPLATIERETKREKVDVIEVEYMDGTIDSPYLTAAETKLKKLVVNYSGRSIRV